MKFNNNALTYMCRSMKDSNETNKENEKTDDHIEIP